MFLVGFSLGPLLVFKVSHLDLCDMREVVATLRASYPAMFCEPKHGICYGEEYGDT